MNKGKEYFLNLQDSVCIHQYLDQLIVFFAQRLTFQTFQKARGEKFFFIPQQRVISEELLLHWQKCWGTVALLVYKLTCKSSLHSL